MKTSVFALLVCLIGCATTRPTTDEGRQAQPTRLFIEADASRRFVIEWDTSFTERERAMWLAYLLSRVRYGKEHLGDIRTEDGVVVPSFAEELDARAAVSKTYRELQRKDPELDIKYFDDLARVSDAGYLPEYTWVYLRQSSWQQPERLNLSAFKEWQVQNLGSHTARTEGLIRIDAQ